jgi:hypothetical protein
MVRCLLPRLLAIVIVVLLLPPAEPTRNAVVCSSRARFTFVSPRVVRLEVVEEGQSTFEDRSSVEYAHRTTPQTLRTPLLVHNQSLAWCNVSVLVHPFLHLSFRKLGRRERLHNGKSTPFSYLHAHSLSITSASLNFTWTADMGQDGGRNLLGTIAPTPSTDLSSCCINPDASAGEWDPHFPLQNGVLSLSGWAILGSDVSPLIEPGFTGDFDAGWIQNRSNAPTSGGTYGDYHFFGCGREFSACLSEFADVSGRMAVPTHRGLGVWWSRHWGDTFDGIPLGVMSEHNILRDVVEGYADHGLPLDVVVCDMEWHVRLIISLSLLLL